MKRLIRVVGGQGDIARLLRRQMGSELEVEFLSLGEQLQSEGDVQDAWVTWWRVAVGEEQQSLDGIARLRERCPAALVVAQAMAEDDDLLRELLCFGASIAMHGCNRLPAVISQIRLFCEKIPPPCLSLDERIWKNLPWGQ